MKGLQPRSHCPHPIHECVIAQQQPGRARQNRIWSRPNPAYIHCHYMGPITAKVFKSGNSQAIRLLKTHRRGSRRVLLVASRDRGEPARGSVARFMAASTGLTRIADQLTKHAVTPLGCPHQATA